MTKPPETWTYADGTLTHVGSQQSIDIEISANTQLHLLLSDQHWYLPPEYRQDYTLADPSDWTERDILWNRASEDPPVLSVERTIGAGDYEVFTVTLLEDAPDFSTLFQDMADLLNDGHANGFTKTHTKRLVKKMVTVLQLAEVI